MLKNESHNVYKFGDSYEKFMTKHLQHYGFYAGNYRFNLKQLNDYEKTHGYNLGNESHSDASDEHGCDINSDETKIPKTTQLIYNMFDDGRVIPMLKAPHVLHHDFVINFRQAPKWPVEMEIIPGRIIHIRTMPSHKEPFYEQNGSEYRPQPKGEDDENIVYESNIYHNQFFIKSKFAPSSDTSKVRSASRELESESDETLLFESRFESGNLEKAYKIGPYEYELHLRTDLYTTKHTQWYYFRVTNTRANKLYRFTIINLYKADSLYNDGLKPLIYSEKDAQQSNKGWRRWGSNIVYYRNNRRYVTAKGEKCFYSLTWTCYLPHDRDTVYFSHCYPYRYSDLMQYIDNIKMDSSKSNICRIKLLTYSLADNLSILLTITNPGSDSVLEKRKKVIVITGRVHPGETNASWMMEGVIDHLLADTPDAKLLRDLFIFKIVPMINPDGVIVGNYRCSLAGRDLNRNYKTQLKSSYPIIAGIRTMIDRILKERDILFYCDLHGHSRKHNIFIYGCNDQTDENELLLERAFPALLNKNSPDKFEYRSCKFKMQKSKAGTGRIVFRNLGITHSFTLEASFCGSTLDASGNYNKSGQFHFNTNDLKSMGEALCNSLLDFCDPDQKQVNDIVTNIREELTKKYISKLESRGVNVDVTKASLVDMTQLDISDDDSSDDDHGSDSSDSNGLPVHYEYMEKQFRTSKKRASKSHDTKETKHNCKEKELELFKTCVPLTKITAGQKIKCTNNVQPEKAKRKTSIVPIKIEFRNTDFKEKIGFLRKMQTMDVMQAGKESPNDVTRRINQELEATKIHLRYSDKTRYQTESNNEQLCPYHELLKDQELSIHQNSFVTPWKPSGNVPDNLYIHKPFKLKANQRLKSGFLSKKIQELRFSPNSDCEYQAKASGIFNQKPLNPIKRVQPMTLIRRRYQESTFNNQGKSNDG